MLPAMCAGYEGMLGWDVTPTMHGFVEMGCLPALPFLPEFQTLACCNTSSLRVSAFVRCSSSCCLIDERIILAT